MTKHKQNKRILVFLWQHKVSATDEEQWIERRENSKLHTVKINWRAQLLFWKCFFAVVAKKHQCCIYILITIINIKTMQTVLCKKSAVLTWVRNSLVTNVVKASWRGRDALPPWKGASGESSPLPPGAQQVADLQRSTNTRTHPLREQTHQWMVSNII